MLSVNKELIKEIQNKLEVPITGDLDYFTQAAIRNYQLKNNLSPTGIITESLVEDLNLETPTTDNSENFSKENSFLIEKYPLPEGEYVREYTKKEYLFLHHTAGTFNPYLQVDIWAKDKRGRIGTHYVIGGISRNTKMLDYDGKILEVINPNFWAYHLGINGYIHAHSVSLEICNLGYLVKKNNKFYDYTNTLVNPSNVVDLGYEFKGFRFWHKYTKKQIDSTENIIKKTRDDHNIDVKLGLIEKLSKEHPSKAFDYDENLAKGNVKGMLSHSNVNKSKYDIFPQEEMLNMFSKL